jgi:hypothetical protein
MVRGSQFKGAGSSMSKPVRRRLGDRGAIGDPAQRGPLAALAAAALLCVVAAYGLAVPCQVSAARVLTVRDEGHLKLVTGEGSELFDEGSVSGTLPGQVRLHFKYSGGNTVSTPLTVSGRGWTIRGEGRVSLSNPASPNPSFRGSLRIIGGSGRYAHAHGSGELFGVFYRRSYGLTVQALGKLSY